jgi:ATP-dependent Clp protease adapter protein ClpS
MSKQKKKNKKKQKTKKIKLGNVYYRKDNVTPRSHIGKIREKPI